MDVNIKEEPGEAEQFLSEPGCSTVYAEAWSVEDTKPNLNEVDTELSCDKVEFDPHCSKVESGLSCDEVEHVAIKEEQEESESSRLSPTLKSESEDQLVECQVKEEDMDDVESLPPEYEMEHIDIKEEGGESPVKADPLEKPEEDKVMVGSSKRARLIVDMAVRKQDNLEENYADSDSEEELNDCELQDPSEEDDNEDSDWRCKSPSDRAATHEFVGEPSGLKQD